MEPPPTQDAAGGDSADDMLVGYLARYEAACPLCGYNLRGLQRPQCPECGKALTLTVGLREPFYAAWITAAVATFACAGLGVFFLLVVVIEGLPGGRGGWHGELFNFIIFGFIATIPAAAAVIIFRKRLLRLERRVQWLVAMCTAGGAAVLFVALAVIAFSSRM